MKDLLVIALMGLFFYVIYCIAAKRPIIPTKKALEKHKAKNKRNYIEQSAEHQLNILEELEPLPFEDLFEHNILSLKEGIFVQADDWFSKIIEVSPVNYYLLDIDEQELIDRITETWFANIDGLLPRIYYQNRFIDLTENIDFIRNKVQEQINLPEAAKEYGRQMLHDLDRFQKDRPRYDLKIYLILDYQVKRDELRVEEGDDLQLMIFDKARTELNRQYQKATQLEKAGMKLKPLTNRGVTELHYHLFQRRRARKLRWANVERNETLALYVTSEQATAEHMASVKEEIDHVSKEKEPAITKTN